MILFGWGHQSKENYGPALPVTCPNCSNETFWELIFQRVFFTLFFIPVFPYESRHYLLCNVCSRGLELKGPLVDKAKRLNQLYKSFANNQISKDQYIDEVNGVGFLKDVAEIEARTTETKIEYDKSGSKTAKFCGACNEKNNSSFTHCWKCGIRFID